MAITNTYKIQNNQWIIWTDNGNRYFKSYNSIIACVDNDNKITLNKWEWSYSATTLKYLKKFILLVTNKYIVTKKEIEDKIKSGEFAVVENFSLPD